MADAKSWRALCGKAVALVGSQAAFKREAAILKRLVMQYGASDVEHMLVGAQLLRWSSLRSLGSKEGIGRRWALEAYWQSQKRAPGKLPENVKSILRGMLT